MRTVIIFLVLVTWCTFFAEGNVKGKSAQKLSRRHRGLEEEMGQLNTQSFQRERSKRRRHRGLEEEKMRILKRVHRDDASSPGYRRYRASGAPSHDATEDEIVEALKINGLWN